MIPIDCINNLENIQAKSKCVICGKTINNTQNNLHQSSCYGCK